MQKIGLLAIGFTYSLMVWGNWLGSVVSGKTCSDWPFCLSAAIPASAPPILVTCHQFTILMAAVFTLATLYKALTRKMHSGSVLFLFIGLQVLLTSVMAATGLSSNIIMSTLQFLVTAFVFGSLIAVTSVMTWNNPVVSTPHPKLVRLSVAGLGGLLVQFILGASVRRLGAGLACPNFPECLETFLPIPMTLETTLAFAHRWWGVLMLGLFFHLAMVAARSVPELANATRKALGLSVAQVFFGIGAVMSGLNTESRAIHAAVGYAIWGILFYVTIRAGGFKWLWQGKTA